MIVHTKLPALFRAEAMCIAPGLILLVPARSGDRALIAHEQEHARQQRATGWLRWWAGYLLCPAFRKREEVAAYRVQIANGGSFEGAARNLSTLYRLGITYEQALLALHATEVPQ